MHQRLFHLAQPLAFEMARESGATTWEPGSLTTEGFLHLSFAEQLRGTLTAHFATATELLLLEIDPERTADALRVELSRGDALFPHLYRALAFDECQCQWLLERRDSGWIVPDLGATADADFPQGKVL